MQDGSINVLDLSIGLWMPHGGEVLPYTELGAPILEGAILELPAVIRDQDLWYAKSVNYALSKKLLDRPAVDRHEWFGLYPFSEIVNSDYQMLMTSWSSGEWT